MAKRHANAAKARAAGGRPAGWSAVGNRNTLAHATGLAAELGLGKKSSGAGSSSSGGSTTAPTTPPADTTAVQPFLTPTQQAALTRWNTTYGTDLNNLGYADTAAWSKYNEDLGQDQLKNAQGHDNTDQAMAARGMFRSSIRDNALNDLDATLAMQTNLLGTARDATLFKDQQTREELSGDNNATQTEYAGLGVENAQSITPTPTMPAPAPPANAPHTAPASVPHTPQPGDFSVVGSRSAWAHASPTLVNQIKSAQSPSPNTATQRAARTRASGAGRGGLGGIRIGTRVTTGGAGLAAGGGSVRIHG